MLKKILIATWTQHDNYGSLLQAYCLKEVLGSLVGNSFMTGSKNVEVRLLNYQARGAKHPKSFVSVLREARKDTIKDNFIKIQNRFLRRLCKKRMMIRCKKMSEFRKNEFNLYPSKTIVDAESLVQLDKFDLYIAGSDQIWNPRTADKAYLLAWTPKEATKISYAPSICVNHLASTELTRFQVLDSYKAISVREYTEAAEQISKLIHKKITEVVDPVILYGRDNLIKKCQKYDVKEDYAAVYLLNGAKKRHDSYKTFLKESGLAVKIIPATTSKSLLFETVLGKNVDWEVGPEEFIDLIYNAKMLITDSFHGVIVALLLHKDFILFPRNEKKSEQDNRLINLLKKLDLEERFGAKIEESLSIDSINWDEVDAKVEKLQRKSMTFLKDAIQNSGIFVKDERSCNGKI